MLTNLREAPRSLTWSSLPLRGEKLLFERREMESLLWKKERARETCLLKMIGKPLKLGYVMVKNRSQAQVKLGTTNEKARADEATFFATHVDFSRSSKTRLFVSILSSLFVRCGMKVEKALCVVKQASLSPQKAPTRDALSNVSTGWTSGSSGCLS